jgi:hypothetical protein
MKTCIHVHTILTPKNAWCRWVHALTEYMAVMHKQYEVRAFLLIALPSQLSTIVQY